VGHRPPDPRFLASLGALSSVELHHCCVLDRTDDLQMDRRLTSIWIFYVIDVTLSISKIGERYA
jgi:hypothetical protein